MKTMIRTATAVLAVALVCACGDDAGGSTDAAAGTPPGHPPVASAHGGAGGPELADSSQFSGLAVLEGELARATTGRVMVMVRERGGVMPSWLYFVDLADPDAETKGLAPERDGRREFAFVLNKDTTMIRSPLPQGLELEVEVRYDADGDIDTKDDRVVVVTPAKPGDDDLHVVLRQ